MTPPTAPKTSAFKGASIKSVVPNDGSTVAVNIHAGQSEYTNANGGHAMLGGAKLKTVTRNMPAAAKISKNLNGEKRRGWYGFLLKDLVHAVGSKEMLTAIVPTIKRAYENSDHLTAGPSARRSNPRYTRPIKTVMSPHVRNAAR